MAKPDLASENKRYAVVTGANKGIGLEICRQLASRGVVVVLTARDEIRGAEAVEKLKGHGGLNENVVFHKLDVADAASIANLGAFIRTQFGRLDILVNNAAISGLQVDDDALKKAEEAQRAGKGEINWDELMVSTYELAVECLQTNYYGVKGMIQTFIPLLQMSKSPRIVNISSSMAKLKSIPNEWAKTVLKDVERLTEEKVEEVLKEFLKDFKEGSMKEKGWPTFYPAYIVSKAALNAYTRILAKKYPNLQVNCVNPGYVKTDINFNTGALTVEEGAEGPVKVALLPDGGPSGLLFERTEISSFE